MQALISREYCVEARDIASRHETEIDSYFAQFRKKPTLNAN